MATAQDYFGENYPDDRTVLSGEGQLTCEQQVGAQRHMMCGNTVKERQESDRNDVKKVVVTVLTNCWV